MYNHAPEEYVCPICLAINGTENNDTLICQSDIVYKNDLVIAFISSFFIGESTGHILISPNKHFENIYDLPKEYGHRVFEVAQKVAFALKEIRKADGIMTLQCNEPAGDQHAFHYHFHVYPRFEKDNLLQQLLDKKSSTAGDRLPFAEKMRKYLKEHNE